MDEERTKQLQECEGVGEKVLRKTFGIDVNAQIGMCICTSLMCACLSTCMGIVVC